MKKILLPIILAIGFAGALNAADLQKEAQIMEQANGWIKDRSVAISADNYFGQVLGAAGRVQQNYPNDDKIKGFIEQIKERKNWADEYGYSEYYKKSDEEKAEFDEKVGDVKDIVEQLIDYVKSLAQAEVQD